MQFLKNIGILALCIYIGHKNAAVEKFFEISNDETLVKNT